MPARRGRGEGSVFQRADGRWVGEVDLGWHMGRRERKNVYGRTRAEVQQRIRALLREIETGVPIAQRGPTVGTYLSDWLVSIRPRLRPKTFVSYESTVRRNITPYLGKYSLQKLTPQQVAALVAQLNSQGLSPTTVKYSLS